LSTKAGPAGPGEEHAVFWWDDEDAGEIFDTELYLATIDPEGTSAREIVRVMALPHSAMWYKYAACEGGYGILWDDGREKTCSGGGCWGNSDLYFAKVDRNGHIVFMDIQITDTEDSNMPEFAFIHHEGVYAAAWVENNNLYFTQFACL